MTGNVFSSLVKTLPLLIIATVSSIAGCGDSGGSAAT